MKKCTPLVILFLLTLNLPQWSLAEDVPLWELGIGAAAWHLPDYPGSDESRFYALPFPYPVYRGKIFRASGSNLSGLLFETNRLRLDLSVSGSLPVNSEHNEARQGMPDLDFTCEFGPSLEWMIFERKSNALWVRAPFRAVFTVPDFSFIGMKFAPYLEYIRLFEILPGWRMSFSVGPTFATERYHDYFYEVEPQFVRPGRSEFHPAGGYSGSGVSFGLTRRFRDFRVAASVHYDNLAGAAFEDSPLVKTNHYLSAGMTFTWFFAKSKTLVPRPLVGTNPVLDPGRYE